MSIAVISYSLTGNNEALAAGVAKELGAEHIKISEPKPRTIGCIILDTIFNRTPKVQPAPEKLEQYEKILLIGPVWMGQPASPLRAYFKYLKAHPHIYAFATISGGALDSNPKLADNIKKRAGAAPAACVDLHIVDFLPKDHKPTAQETSAYRLNDDDKLKLTEAVVKSIRDIKW